MNRFGVDESDRGPVEADLFHARGLRRTAHRQHIFDAVCELDRSTPEQILAQVRKHAAAVNISTVYRTLELFARLDMVCHHHLGHGAPVYSVRSHAHVHLSCEECDMIHEMPPSVLDGVAADLARHTGFRLDPVHVALPGRCASCSGTTARGNAVG